MANLAAMADTGVRSNLGGHSDATDGEGQPSGNKWWARGANVSPNLLVLLPSRSIMPTKRIDNGQEQTTPSIGVTVMSSKLQILPETSAINDDNDNDEDDNEEDDVWVLRPSRCCCCG